MIAASLKDGAGDAIIDLLLRKGADVTIKSNSGQVRVLGWICNPELFLRANRVAECASFRKFQV
jgi:hypothetical protein